MQLYLKLALGNVRRGARDYSVYFATLGFAACLLYSFVASTDYLLALWVLAPNRWACWGARAISCRRSPSSPCSCSSSWSGMPIDSCSAAASASSPSTSSCGMGRGAVSAFVLVAETALVGAVRPGAAVSRCGCGTVARRSARSPPSCSTCPWRLAFAFSPESAVWTAGCFAVMFAVNAVDGARNITRRPADRAHVRRARPRSVMRLGGRVVARAGQVVLAAVPARGRMGSVPVPTDVLHRASSSPWASPRASPPSLVARLGVAAWWAERARELAPRRYWDGLTRVHGAAGRGTRVQLPRWPSPAYACSSPSPVCMMVAGIRLQHRDCARPRWSRPGIVGVDRADRLHRHLLRGGVPAERCRGARLPAAFRSAVDARRAYGDPGPARVATAPLCARPCVRQLALYFRRAARRSVSSTMCSGCYSSHSSSFALGVPRACSRSLRVSSPSRSMPHGGVCAR